MMHRLNEILPNSMHVIDLAAIAVIGAAWFQLLPAAAALLAALWYAVQIWESDTVRRMTNRIELKKDATNVLKDPGSKDRSDS